MAFSTCAVLDDYSILIYFLPTIRVPEINCNNGRVYKVCGPISDETCSGPVAEPIRTATDLCIERCYCPNDSALHKDQCIRRSECPCTLRQKTYQPGEQVPNDCNTWSVLCGFSTSVSFARMVLVTTWLEQKKTIWFLFTIVMICQSRLGFQNSCGVLAKNFLGK